MGAVTDAAATIFLLVVGLSFLQNVQRGTAREWLAAKFLNRGAPEPGRSIGTASTSRVGAGELTRQTSTTPLLDPVPGGQFVSPWGAPRDGGSRSHEGIDLAAPRGTAVRASAAGTVVRVGTLTLCGKRVAIDHGNGVESIYCHLDTFAVSEGQTVRRGQTIGTVGNTGNARTTGPHLHYEVHRNGSPLNPAPLIGR